MSRTPGTREEHIRSIERALEHEGRLLRHVADAGVESVGPEEARAALDEALLRYGEWRGRSIRRRHRAAGVTLTARSLLEQWGTGDVHGPLELGWGEATGSSRLVSLTIRRSPEWTHLARGPRWLPALYHRSLFRGVARGYGDGLEVTVPDEGFGLTAPYTVAWIVAGAPDDDAGPVSSRALADPEGAYRVSELTMQSRAALWAFLARGLLDRFDANGEWAAREGARRFGAERGSEIREVVIGRGRPVDMAGILENYDSGGDHIWKWKDEGHLSPGTWRQECTYCPFVPVWRELHAMDLGYIYDYEFHLAQYRAYHPGARVAWEALQTRGDATCLFHFSIPELRQPDDPGCGGTPPPGEA